MERVILLNELRKIQKKEGFISEKAIKGLYKKTDIPLSQIYSVVTFYSKLFTVKQGRNIIEICNGPSCYLNNSVPLIKHLEKKLKIKSGEITKDKKFSLHISSCIGQCDGCPSMLINGKPHRELTEKKIEEILKKCK